MREAILIGATVVAGATLLALQSPPAPPPARAPTKIETPAKVVPPPVVKREPVVVTPPPEPTTRPAPKPASKPAPRPKLHVPAPIMKPERRETRSKRDRKAAASLPSCARVRAVYNSMTVAQRWAAYRTATPEQIAHGRRCLGL